MPKTLLSPRRELRYYLNMRFPEFEKQILENLSDDELIMLALSMILAKTTNL